FLHRAGGIELHLPEKGPGSPVAAGEKNTGRFARRCYRNPGVVRWSAGSDIARRVGPPAAQIRQSRTARAGQLQAAATAAHAKTSRPDVTHHNRAIGSPPGLPTACSS